MIPTENLEVVRGEGHGGWQGQAVDKSEGEKPAGRECVRGWEQGLPTPRDSSMFEDSNVLKINK